MFVSSQCKLQHHSKRQMRTLMITLQVALLKIQKCFLLMIRLISKMLLNALAHRATSRLYPIMTMKILLTVST